MGFKVLPVYLCPRDHKNLSFMLTADYHNCDVPAQECNEKPAFFSEKAFVFDGVNRHARVA